MPAPDPADAELVPVRLLENLIVKLPRGIVRRHRIEGMHLVQRADKTRIPRIMLSEEQRAALAEDWKRRNPDA